MTKIALLAALPQEYKALLSRVEGVERIPATTYPTYRWQVKRLQFLLIETGMGGSGSRLKDIVDRLISEQFIDGLISTGFAGACSQRLAVGDVVVAHRLIRHDIELRHRTEHELRVPSTGLSRLVHDHGAIPCALITTDRPLPKKDFTSFAPDLATAMDMESAHLALAAYHNDLPFCCIRSISDALEDRIDFDISALSDHQNRIHPGKAVGSLLRHPSRLPQFYRAWQRARIAALSLAECLSWLIDRDQDQWRSLLVQTRLHVR